MLLHALALVSQSHQQGRRKEDGGENTLDDTDELNQREVAQRADTHQPDGDDEERDDGQCGNHGRRNRAHHRLVNGQVGELGIGLRALAF